MAIFTPSESPAVIVREIDLTGVVPNVQSTTGGFVGNFRWGPVEETTLIDGEASLVSTFGTPSDSNAVDFLSAAYFLRYSNSLQVVRMVDGDSAGNATDGGGNNVPLVKNRDDFDNQALSLDSDNHIFFAKYPGALGNSLLVSTCPANDSAFSGWSYSGEFDAAPGTSSYAAAAGASNDEMHVVVVDEDGDISGSRGTVLERFPYVSLASDAKNTDGSTNYIINVINDRSRYIWMAGFGPTDSAGLQEFDNTSGQVAASGLDYADDSAGLTTRTASFTLGKNSITLNEAKFASGFDLLEDKDNIQVDFLIAPGMSSSVAQTTVVNDLVTIAQSTRKDCVVVASPARTDIVGSTTPVTSAVATANNFTSSSYLIMDNNYLKVYDKYNDKYRWIPAASSTAGLMAATDFVAAPWFSPAGARRGQYLGVTSLSYTPTKSERDTLYKAGINPIANIPGQGVLLYGDKTKLNRPSAFDRINVRRLFLVIERAIAIAARNVLFEFNDEFTRAEFVNIVEPFLREIQGRRGITDFRVVCDETNNTPAVIDRNEFVASIFIKPARSINYVTLNFVGVRTGVEFEEVVGTV